jgi:hypothetical protein
LPLHRNQSVQQQLVLAIEILGKRAGRRGWALRRRRDVRRREVEPLPLADELELDYLQTIVR